MSRVVLVIARLLLNEDLLSRPELKLRWGRRAFGHEALQGNCDLDLSLWFFNLVAFVKGDCILDEGLRLLGPNVVRDVVSDVCGLLKFRSTHLLLLEDFRAEGIYFAAL